MENDQQKTTPWREEYWEIKLGDPQDGWTLSRSPTVIKSKYNVSLCSYSTKRASLTDYRTDSKFKK